MILGKRMLLLQLQKGLQQPLAISVKKLARKLQEINEKTPQKSNKCWQVGSLAAAPGETDSNPSPALASEKLAAMHIAAEILIAQKFSL